MISSTKKKFKRTTSSDNDNDNFKFNSLKNSTSTFKEKSLNLDKISIQEINEDFLSWSQNMEEEEECFEEINNILSCSTKDCSFDSQNKKNKGCRELSNGCMHIYERDENYGRKEKNLKVERSQG